MARSRVWLGGEGWSEGRGEGGRGSEGREGQGVRLRVDWGPRVRSGRVMGLSANITAQCIN